MGKSSAKDRGSCADDFFFRAARAAQGAAVISRHKDKSPSGSGPVGLRCCGCGTRDGENHKEEDGVRLGRSIAASPAASLDRIDNHACE